MPKRIPGQVRLDALVPERQKKWLFARAEELGISSSELLRRVLDKAIMEDLRERENRR